MLAPQHSLQGISSKGKGPHDAVIPQITLARGLCLTFSLTRMPEFTLASYAVVLYRTTLGCAILNKWSIFAKGFGMVGAFQWLKI